MTENEAFQRILDREEIKEVRAKYCRYLDCKLWDELRSVFVDDAHLDLGGGVQHDPDSFVAAMKSSFTAGGELIHQCMMPDFQFASDTSARAVWALFAYSDRVRDGERAAGKSYGYYEEEYRKEGGAWKISYLRIVRLRGDTAPIEGLPEFSADREETGRQLERFYRRGRQTA